MCDPDRVGDRHREPSRTVVELGSAADQTKGQVRDGGAIDPEHGRACHVGRYPACTTPARRPDERDAIAAEIRVLRSGLH